MGLPKVLQAVSANPAKPGDIQDTFFLNSGRFPHDKPYNIKMQLKFVMFEDLLFLTFS